ncbi:MAG TPA: hypothetical protein VFQ85_19285 [Mycobacteriales bacterium]|jgi:hypothetical protein|nr:hypothetical protein [Mycobacteriales bacterium]
MRTIQRTGTVAAATVATCLALTGTALAAPPELATARAATARFHDLAVATDEGYGRFTDRDGVACIDQPGEGGMGVHYVQGALVGDPAVSAGAPEALVYAPRPDGTLRLVAAEYVVIASAWDADHDDPPSLFGQEFELVPAGNRYDLPPFYELHAWIWRDNVNGMFADWNPAVTCP